MAPDIWQRRSTGWQKEIINDKNEIAKTGLEEIKLEETEYETTEFEEIALEKLENLKNYLLEKGRIAVAFSGGVDSTFLLKVAHDVLKDNAIAITATAEFVPDRELAESKQFCEKENIHQEICTGEQMKEPAFTSNPPDRCYICKRALFTKMKEIAVERGDFVLVEGSNADDCHDYRPGMKAIKELGILSPLQEINLSKSEIRFLSEKLKLSTWDKPSYACLASRFVYGENITTDKLSMVDRAEQLLLDLGFRQFRVRLHGKMARIEILPEEFDKIIEEKVRTKITSKFREYGFTYVSLDLNGYRAGSMNETLQKKTPADH